MKSTTLTVAAAAMVFFVQSAQAREHHHGHRHHHAVARRGALAGAPSTPNGLFAFAAANVRSSMTAYRGARPGASGCLVRLGDAPSGGRGSGALIQSGAQLGALGQTGRRSNRSRGRVATPCRQNCRSAKRTMGHRIRQ